MTKSTKKGAFFIVKHPADKKKALIFKKNLQSVDK